MKSKQFNILQEKIKAVTDDNGTLYIVGIANTGQRDLVGDVITENALKEIAEQAVNRNLHLNHDTWDLDGIIGVITEAEVISEGVQIKARILKKYQETIQELLDEGVRLGLSIAGKAHYVDNSYEQIESWDLTEISLTPTPCDQGTMGTVRISKSFNEFIKTIDNDNNMEEKAMADEETYLTQEQAEELINAAFNEKEEELLEQVRGELKEEYETKFQALEERIVALESQEETPAPEEGEEGEKGEGSNEEEDEEEEKRIDSLVEKKTEELIKQIFGKPSPQFDYENEKGESTPDKNQKTFTAREIAEIITGGN